MICPRSFLRSILLIALGAFSLIVGTGPQLADAQGLGPLQLEAEMFGAAGTGENLPFWLAANQYGMVDPTSTNTGLRLDAQRPFEGKSGFDYALGAEVLGRASQNGTLTVQQLYGRLRYGRLQLTVGRREQMIGRVDTSLSLGSVTWSRNAPPPPKISLSSDGYVPVPGTGRGLALKGYLAHWWLEEDRFVRNTLLHEKYLYFCIRPPGIPVTAYVGLVHHAQWGGTHPQKGPQASSLREWADVALVTDVFTEDRTEAESRRSNANHLGMYDFSLGVDLGGWRGLAYRQFYHEDVASLWFRNVWDGLWGVRFRRDDNSSLVSAVLWEHLRMTRQNARFSAGEERGADRYYDNAVYQGGWTYQGRTLGIPLITPTSETPGLQGDLPGIGNSIVVAHHVGIEGHLGARVGYQVLGTYSRNYGANAVCSTPECTSFIDQRTDRRDQWSFRVRIDGSLLEQYRLRFHAAAALDIGEFYEERIGFRLGLQWQGTYTEGDR